MFSRSNLYELIRQIMVKIVLFCYSNVLEHGFLENTKSKLLQRFAIMQRIKK